MVVGVHRARQVGPARRRRWRTGGGPPRRRRRSGRTGWAAPPRREGPARRRPRRWPARTASDPRRPPRWRRCARRAGSTARCPTRRCRWRPGSSRADPGRWPPPAGRGPAWREGSGRPRPSWRPGRRPRHRAARRPTPPPPCPPAPAASTRPQPERRRGPSRAGPAAVRGRRVDTVGHGTERSWRGRRWARQGRARHTWAMKSTMQDAPLLISDILRHGQQVHGDSTVITVEAGGHRAGHLRRGGDAGREAGGRPDPPGRRARATASARSAGTTRATSRPTSPSRPWGRCCTRSTSGSPPSSWPT